MKWQATFWGRKVGAIGVCGHCTVIVDADSKDEARLKLYDTHEHISGLLLNPLRDELPPKVDS